MHAMVLRPRGVQPSLAKAERPVRPSAQMTTSAPRMLEFSWLNIPRLHAPLPTLNVPPRDGPSTARGKSGSYSLLLIGLPPNIQLPVSLAHHPVPLLAASHRAQGQAPQAETRRIAHPHGYPRLVR